MQETRPFPIGLIFKPTDEELIEDYLHKRVSGIPIPFVEYFVRDCILYGDHEPSVIWESYGGFLLNKEEDLYFFTQLKPKGSRFCREVSISGGWQGSEEIISTKTKLPIGFKKRFHCENEGSEDDGRWIMHEYTLHPSQLAQNQATNYALCRIRNNQPTETGKQLKKSDANKSKKRKWQHDSVECDSEATTSAVTMLEQESSYKGDMKMSEQYVVALTVPDHTQQESHQQQMIYVNNVESQHAATMAMMRDRENGNAETNEILGIHYCDVPLVEADEIPVALAVPDHTQQDQQQVICVVNNVEFHHEETMAVIRDLENGNLETSETLGIDYYDVPLGEADDIVQAVAIAILQDDENGNLVNNVEFHHEETMVVIRDLENSNLETSENPGIDFYDVPLGEAYEIVQAVAIAILQDDENGNLVNKVEFHHEETMAVVRDLENGNLETSDTLGIDYYDVPLGEADEIVQAVAIAILQDNDCVQLPDLPDEDFLQLCDLFY